ncbi:hypothetical protein KR093_009997 [Drosophila rubida]|uniref:Uncharacterized protein n=1 Tax=Drosophila rubida TaxID=30044 RepID=A0AAD4K681_9MUSC|nr:hypothetical protein KR093_009997 [Drosophila rubida]
MMAFAFKNPTYPYMVNLQNDLIDRQISEYKVAHPSRCTSDLMNRMSPEIRAQLFQGNARVRHINWSKILKDFLPRNPQSTDTIPNKQRNKQYKPVVLRNKTPFVQLNPDPFELEVNTSSRPSSAYTLPQNRDSDVRELRPTGDSSTNNLTEMRNIVLPFYQRILSFDLQSVLRTLTTQLQDIQSMVMGSDSVRQLNRVLNFLYDLFVSITIGGRQAVPRLQRAVLDTYAHFNTFDGIAVPLSLHVVPSNASTYTPRAVFNELPRPRIEQSSLSGSNIASYGRNCCPEKKNVQSNPEPGLKAT